MSPPSTNVAPAASTTAPISRAVAGATALPSTNRPVKRHAATARARSTAACGGHTESTTSLAATTASRRPASSRPALAARSRVPALRPSEAHSTPAPAARAQAPTTAPMSPGCSSPTVVMRSSSLVFPRQVREAARGYTGRPGQITRPVNGLDLHFPQQVAQQHRDEAEHGQERREHQRGQDPHEESLHASRGPAHHTHEDGAHHPTEGNQD